MGKRSHLRCAVLVACALGLSSCATNETPSERAEDGRSWLAGDHHIHSRFSVGWDYEQSPPAPIIGGDAIYPTPMNALMARYFGLAWMVTTDHGGPNHAKLNRDVAYPELVQSRKVVSDVIQFYGMELNTPGGDHSSLIIPHTHDEADVLYRLESGFDKRDAFPADPARDDEEKMIVALTEMKEFDNPPVVIANHPSRSAQAYGVYGLYHPAELRRWNDTAPNVAVGMAGAPGHQAVTLSTSEQIPMNARARGGYRGYPTMGGFDQLTAKLGGFWDSMLGEGRRWWITANSDSHVHYTEGGVDFWPGEYSKTYVFAEKSHDAILAALRAGHVFVTTGDLVSEVGFSATSADSTATMGGELTVNDGAQIVVSIRVRDPAGANHGGFEPSVARIDLIVGEITGPAADPTTNSHASARVAKRFSARDWQKNGEYLTMQHELTADGPIYLRVRGTNTGELEPSEDPPAEDPWEDLWFYGNPIFVQTR